MTASPARSPARARAFDALLWMAPVVFLLWLYREGLQCWFIGDDFAWLGLLRHVHGLRDLPAALFASEAQGTIRPWSERGFFLLFESLYGLDDLPFRIMAFSTMAANLLLAAWITRRITQSRFAGLLAAVVWGANTSLVTVMSWSAAYNQALCPFFLLAALALFMLYAETGRRRFWWLQLAVFVLGFGALEINIVYPVIAAAYALFVAPPERRGKLLRATAPLPAISVAYFFLHRAAAPFQTTGVYALRFDARIFESLRLYGKWSLLPVDWEAFGHSPRRGILILWTGIAALILLSVREIRARRGVALFFATWYLATLAPILPLPDHRGDYYLTIPVCGLAMLAAWGCSRAWAERQLFGGLVATVAVAGYLAGMIPVSQAATHWWLNKSVAVKGLVLGVEAARASHPGKTILLDGVTATLYADSVGQSALTEAGKDLVYLTPETAPNIRRIDGLADPDKFILDPAAALHAIRSDQVVVYSLAGDHLRNITEAYERSAPTRLIDRDPNNPLAAASAWPGRVDVGNPLYSWLLGPSWMPIEAGVRWMPGRATLRLKQPRAGNKLLIDGYCPEEQLKRAPRHLIVSAVGSFPEVVVGETQISDPESDFHRLFAIPPSVIAETRVESLEIEIRVDPVNRIDGRDYGLVFGKIAIVP